MLPLATAFFALWACGGEDDSSTVTQPQQDPVEQQVADAVKAALGPDVNLDSLKTANPAFVDSIRSVILMTANFETASSPSSSADASGELSSGVENPVETGSSSSDASTPANPASSGENPASSSGISSPASSGEAPVAGSSSSGEHSHHHHGSSSSSGPAADPASSSVAPSSTSTPSTQASSDFVEDHRSECQIGDIPTSVNNAKLPDPFKGLDGKRISTKAEWKCRREEIAAMYEKIMFGQKPRNPEKVEGSFSGGKLKVTVTDKGKSISFSVSISGGGTKDKPKPGIIGFASFGGCGSLGASTNGLGVAMISFNPDDVAPENGGGSFFKLYSGSDAGTAIAWAWGISRVIDALEKTPEAGIDAHHLGVTGCSRHGKGSLIAGAFDERIALVIPQESGSGGASLWRSIAQVNKQKGTQFVQGLASAGTEGGWMKSSFKNYDGKETTLPFDQHMLTAMVAPRALLVLDNQSFDWLGEVPSNYCGHATLEVFKALGIEDNYTYAQKGGHNHCDLPQDHYDEVKAYVNAFLNESGTTKGKVESFSSIAKWNASEWIDWDTPTLK